VTFPTATTTSGNSAGNVTTYTVTVPAVSSGQLVIVCVVKDGIGTPTWPTTPEWTQISQLASSAHRLMVRFRRIDGTEGWGSGGSFDLTSSSEGFAHAMAVIDGAHASTDPVGTFVTATDANPDPPVCPAAGDLSWGTEDTLWIVTYGWDGNNAHSAYPTNYANDQITDRWANTGGSGVAMATRELAAANEDPGTATIGGSDQWVAATIAVRPAATGGGTNYTEAPTDTEGLTDTQAFDQGKILTDSEALTDTRAIDQDKTLPVEPLGLTDAATRDIGHPEADNLGLTDAVITESGREETPTDTLGLTDTVQTETSKAVAPADDLGLTDTAATAGDFQRDQTDTLGLTDTLGISGDRTLDLADDAELTDTAGTVGDFQRSAADNLGLTDSLVVDVGKLVDQADTLGLTDTRTFVVDAQRAPAETVGLTDTLIFEIEKVLLDEAAVLDAVAIVAAYERSLTDTLGLTDERTGGVGEPDLYPIRLTHREQTRLTYREISRLTYREAQ
jgi:hypothetical protein